MPKYQVYLDKNLESAFEDYVADHGGVVNACLRKFVIAGLRRAGYPQTLTQDQIDRKHRERRAEEERVHQEALERRRNRRAEARRTRRGSK